MTSFRILLAYLSVMILWGSTYLAIRIGVMDIPPALLASSRFLLAGIILVVASLALKRDIPWDLLSLRHLAIVGTLLLVGGNYLVVWAEQSVSSGLAAVIIAIVPLFMSSIDALIPGGSKLPATGWIGIFVGFVGVVILVSPAMGVMEGEDVHPAGTLALVGAAFFWSLGSIYSKRHPVRGDIFAATGLQMLFGGILLGLLAIASGEYTTVRLTQSGVLSVLYLIVCGSILGFTGYAYLLRHVSPAKASTYAYVNPVVAVFLGAVFLAEPIELRTIVATIVILGGVGLVQVAKMKAA